MLFSILFLLLLLVQQSEGGKWWQLWGKQEEKASARNGGSCLYAAVMADVPSDADLRSLAARAAFFTAAVTLAEPRCDSVALVARHVLAVPAIAALLAESGLAALPIDLPVPLREVAGQDLQRNILVGRGWELLRLAPLSLSLNHTADVSVAGLTGGYSDYDRVVLCGGLDSSTMMVPVAPVDASLLPDGERGWSIALPAAAPSGPLMVIRPDAVAAAAVSAALSAVDASPWLLKGIKGGKALKTLKVRERYEAAVNAPAFQNAVAAAKLTTGELAVVRCGSTTSGDVGGWCAKGKEGGREGLPVLAGSGALDICQDASENMDFWAAAAKDAAEKEAAILQRFGEVLKSEPVRKACGLTGGSTIAVETPAPPPPPLARQPQPADKIVLTGREVKALQYFALANEKEKILMLAIPKVGCTQVNQLFLRMHGSKGWNAALTFQVHAHKDRHRFFASKLSPERLSAIFNDPSWTRAVFLRDPASRLLSAYLDKFVFKMSYGTKLFKKPVSLRQLVDLLQPEALNKFRGEFPGPMLGLTPYTNPHWRAQAAFFAGGGDGGSRLLPYFNYLGRIEHAESHARELLQAAGLWERFGASGWGPDGKSTFFAPSTGSSHATAASQKETMYFDEALLERVRRAYKQDYALLERFFPP